MMITLPKSRNDQNDDSFAKKRGRSMMMIALQKSRKDQNDDNFAKIEEGLGKVSRCLERALLTGQASICFCGGDNISNILNTLDVSNSSNIRISLTFENIGIYIPRESPVDWVRLHLLLW